MNTKIVQFGQQIVSSDKTAIASAIVGGLTILAAKFGFRMNGADVAYLSAGVMGALGVFVHSHFSTTKAQAAASARLYKKQAASASPAVLQPPAEVTPLKPAPPAA